jgi:uncharacterized membrane protein
MRSYYFPFLLAVGGSLLYHLSQRSVPKDANPFYATVIAYAVGAAVCVVCAQIFPAGKSLVETARGANWAVVGVGVAAVLIELGFLLAYRAGWQVSLAAVSVNVAVTAALIPVGVLVFKDQLSPRNVVGLVFCVLGLVLVARD